jgi:putative DNA primase/helicase
VSSRTEVLPSTSEHAIELAFAHRHEHHLRYVAIWGRWLSYDGSRWNHDDTLHAFDLARDICREAALGCRKPITSIASAKTVAAVTRLAQADRRLAAKAAQWDAAPELLTADAMTFDLRTGIGRDPAPLDYITKKTGCAVAPARTPHPLWTAFLDRITDHNVDLLKFLQRYIGYCCTGFTTEHVFVFAYGTGANGKSTFINTVANVLGDYVTVADMGTFIASGVERHATDLAKLQGARLVISQETQKGRRWDEPKIKSITAGDKQAARFMRQDYFDFVPVCKLFICGNHKPRLSAVDEAMRRRLLIIPFTVQIPAAERDPDLPHKLESEWPAILRWCLDGCLEWQRIGLAPPDAVRTATDSYFDDQDTLQQWLDECTHDPGPFTVTRLADLFSSWKLWCEAGNTKPGASTTLSAALVERGFEKTRQAGTGKTAFRKLAIRQV